MAYFHPAPSATSARPTPWRCTAVTQCGLLAFCVTCELRAARVCCAISAFMIRVRVRVPAEPGYRTQRNRFECRCEHTQAAADVVIRNIQMVNVAQHHRRAQCSPRSKRRRRHRSAAVQRARWLGRAGRARARWRSGLSQQRGQPRPRRRCHGPPNRPSRALRARRRHDVAHGRDRRCSRRASSAREHHAGERMPSRSRRSPRASGWRRVLGVAAALTAVGWSTIASAWPRLSAPARPIALPTRSIDSIDGISTSALAIALHCASFTPCRTPRMAP